jgi:hypothetical protein
VSIGLFLLAKFDSPVHDPDRFLQQTALWLHQNYSDMMPETRQGFVEACPTLFCRFHPAAEEVELSLLDLEHLTASANTSTVGPGYHVFVCSMLQSWARDFHASWQASDADSGDYCDEADYFFTREPQNVFDQMTSWLQALANTFFDGTLESPDKAVVLCMPLDSGFQSEQFAITPLGPRGRNWLLETSRDGVKGADFFAWWRPGFHAEYFLGRALAQMWTEVRWRRPINDAERKLLENVANSLHIAHELDPSLTYPWGEWAEVLEFLDAQHAEADYVRSRSNEPATIGYRRGNVWVTLPGSWQIEVPGSFSDFDADEDNAFFALDPPREVWFTAYSFTVPQTSEQFESERHEILLAQAELLREDKEFIAKASIQEKIDKSHGRYFVLQSSNRCPGKRSLCTIVFADPADKKWAIGVWRSLQP